jgi:hypothetical protein
MEEQEIEHLICLTRSIFIVPKCNVVHRKETLFNLLSQCTATEGLHIRKGRIPEISTFASMFISPHWPIGERKIRARMGLMHA